MEKNFEKDPDIKNKPDVASLRQARLALIKKIGGSEIATDAEWRSRAREFERMKKRMSTLKKELDDFLSFNPEHFHEDPDDFAEAVDDLSKELSETLKLFDQNAPPIIRNFLELNRLNKQLDDLEGESD